MRILYYVWNEFTGEDTRMVMRELGHDVEELRYSWNRLDEDEGFERVLENSLRMKKDGKKIDCAFTWNFFPIISRVCHRMHIPYISWVFDSPHFPLASKEVVNSENRIYLFDKGLVDLYKKIGIDTVDYSPLAVNSVRLKALSDKLSLYPCYEHDVTFLGNLYDNEYNFYDFTAEYLPEDLRTFFEDVMERQRHTFDEDLIADENIISRGMIQKLNEYMKFSLSEDKYDFDQDILIRDILKKKVTQDERRILLEDLGLKFKLDLYTKANGPTLLNVRDLGEADYMGRMPHVFNRSKINLNFMMRSIRTGMSLRVLDVMGSGGFLISTYRSELSEYFTDGQDLVIVHNSEELPDKIDYYLRHEEERKEIARRGQEKVFSLFDYRIILPKILELS
ncbi:MAG: glycosyltransferase [Butyrivibrio sp.]|uniref:glycosyltransferase family protein n=1 Tax=Butyrivibrio sp. TaxID=28121 RepID=UPI0025D62E9E|nr:glycosyltransferase [Butyrivibrio sp.]MCR5773036.1 glycosyltransferase [Butyrivibrio sp.]